MFSDIFDKLFNRSTDNSRNDVKQRLQVLLAHDRADITPQILEKIRREIIEVVSKYVEIDDEGLEFMLESDQRLSALVVNFPIRRMRSGEEEREPVTTTDAPIVLDKDGESAAKTGGEAAAIAPQASGETGGADAAKQPTQPTPKKPKDTKAVAQREGPPPEVVITPDDDIPTHMNLDLDAGLGSTPASES